MSEEVDLLGNDSALGLLEYLEDADSPERDLRDILLAILNEDECVTSLAFEIGVAASAKIALEKDPRLDAGAASLRRITDDLPASEVNELRTLARDFLRYAMEPYSLRIGHNPLYGQWGSTPRWDAYRRELLKYFNVLTSPPLVAREGAGGEGNTLWDSGLDASVDDGIIQANLMRLPTLSTWSAVANDAYATHSVFSLPDRKAARNAVAYAASSLISGLLHDLPTFETTADRALAPRELSKLPRRFRSYYDVGFARRLLVCVISLTDMLHAPARVRARCVADQLIIILLKLKAERILDELSDTGDQLSASMGSVIDDVFDLREDAFDASLTYMSSSLWHLHRMLSFVPDVWDGTSPQDLPRPDTWFAPFPGEVVHPYLMLPESGEQNGEGVERR
ncbi:hypothetical protein Nocox_06945 [Nonomuraea coxensis DSM 45129]|uniref:Uncharacterized protein n=1 Tax=Nonomuraea coxensis DSM 45129 TaxID=1122611 RepID=A0ABX8TWD4_9ACTN|nr:hypothetical protein [Nonomuraea coxensis]QYC39016.1 hypothetical protein Nocox_06945 [Nonomuraea coxensis DSM 45129]